MHIPSETPSDIPIPEHPEYKKYYSCPNTSHRFEFVNSVTGKTIPLSCNKYACPYCGPKKAAKLRGALIKYFKQYKYIRMWTFTLSNTVASDPYEHYKLLTECWRRLITELRRNKIFSSRQKKFDYVRVIDIHKSGFLHFHCLFTEYFLQKHVQSIWESICQEVTKQTRHVSQCNAIGLLNAPKAANYVTKYVLKCASYLYNNQKKWTRSRGISIFEKRKSTGEWYLQVITVPEHDYYLGSSPLFNLTSNPKEQLRGSYSEFSDSDPPEPDILRYFQICCNDLDVNLEFELLNFSENIRQDSFSDLINYFSNN